MPDLKAASNPLPSYIATLIAGGVDDTTYELMGACYTVAAYLTSVGTLEVSEDNLLVRDSAIYRLAMHVRLGIRRRDV